MCFQKTIVLPLKVAEMMDNENEFRELIENLSVGVLKQGPDASILISNQAALNMLGLTKDQLLGKTSFDPDWNVIHEDGSAFPGNTHPVPVAIANLKPVRDVVMCVYRPVSKDRVWLLVNALPHFTKAGKLDHVICTFIDITQKKKSELLLKENERIIQKSKRFYEFTSKVNDLILHEKETEIIYTEICKIAVESGGFLFAWIGEPDKAADWIIPTHSFKHAEGYLNTGKVSAKDISEGRGPTGRAFREGKYYYCNNIAVDPAMAPWREAALKRGYRSSIALPFLLNGQVVAVITLYAGEPEIFTEEEIQLLVRAAKNISFALNGIALEKERKLTEAALEEKTKFVTNILESSLDIISVLDKNGKRVYLSKSAEQILGFSYEQLMQTSLFEYIPEEEREFVVNAFQQKKDIQNLTHRMLYKDGRLKYFSLSSRWDPVSEYRYSISKDITSQMEESQEKERLKIEAEQKIKKAVFEGEENEKLLLSLELHDNISQILSAARMFLGMYIKKGNHQYLEESMQLLEQSIKETRNLSHSIALPKLKEIGLKDSVQLLLNHYNEAEIIRFTLIAHYLEIDIPYDLEINIYRIIQEQINNIVKHSKATSADIFITEINRKLTIEITDDGIGFNPTEKAYGIGLMNMKTRVNLFYGKMDILSQPMQGCKLIIEFYLDQDFQ